MTTSSPATLDKTGKIELKEIYNCPDPRKYFSTLGQLEYIIPQAAKPFFNKVFACYRNAKDSPRLKIVDLGTSYGINAALLKYGLDLQDLYQLYGSEKAQRLSHSELVERDRRLFRNANADPNLEIVGVDVADRAVAYAENVHVLDGSVAANLEEEKPDPSQQKKIADADIIISTGCIGYITGRTLTAILETCSSKRPWMAHFVLRMFSFEPIREQLASRGYVTAKGTQPLRQRRFASRAERERILDKLIGQGIDPTGYESEGWLYADLYVSRPVSDINAVPATTLTAG